MLTPLILQEINYGFDAELKAGRKTATGTRVTAMQFFSGIIHRSATRVMIGPELCRDERFLKDTTALLESIFFTAIVAVNVPLGPLRNVLSGLFTLPHKWKLQRCAKTLQPLVEARMRSRKLHDYGHANNGLGDGIEWTLKLTNGDSKYDTPERLTHELLHNLWAASSAPGGMMTEIVYQMLTYPEYMQPMRDEAEAAVKEHGWTEKMLASLHLQDSFIREVNRLLPTGAITCSRTVVGAPFKFSDGLELPVGTRFGFPIKAMQSDPDNFSSPTTFDGFRFAKQSSSESGVEEDRRRWSSTAMSTTNLAWGYGNHVCPGRFFAVRMIKFTLTKVLLEYEIEWDRTAEQGRPECVLVEGQFVPNLKQQIVLRKRDSKEE
jgi:cytochrome P450